MLDNSENQVIYNFISKKAFELSYAFCRISQALENKSFAKFLEEKALALLCSATEKDISNTEQIALTLEYFIHLADAINLIRQDLVEILIAELNGFKQYIKENKAKLFLPNIEISNIFETNLKTIKNLAKKNKGSAKYSAIEQDSAKVLVKDSAINNNSAKHSIMDSVIEQDSVIYLNSTIDLAKDSEIDSAKDSVKQKSQNMYSATNINSAIDSSTEDSAINSVRNSAITDFTYFNDLNNENNIGFKHISQIIKDNEKIFQTDDSKSDLNLKKITFFEKLNTLEEFRLKDLESLFPDLSERTIRYYLSDLVNMGLVEKIGVSGPNVLYRLKR